MALEYKLSYTANDINNKLGKIDSLAEKNELPTKTSELTNDSGFATETYVQGYAQPKGDYALKNEIPEVSVQSVNGQIGDVNLGAEDVGALPDTTVIPTKVSDLTNDSGFITSYTETDPTVPAWAKEESKPTYTADEIGAVGYTEQTLTDEQKQQAQDNIGFSEIDAIEIVAKMELVYPVAAEDGSIYTDENGDIYSL